MVGYKINIQKSSSNQFENVIKKIPHSNNKKIQKQKQLSAQICATFWRYKWTVYGLVELGHLQTDNVDSRTV